MIWILAILLVVLLVVGVGPGRNNYATPIGIIWVILLVALLLYLVGVL